MGGVFLFSLKMLCSLFGCLLLLRVYMRYMGTPSNDPLYSFASTLTDWAVKQAATFIKRQKNLDWPAIFVAYLVAFLYQFIHWLLGPGSFSLFAFFISSAVLVIYWAIQLAMWIALFYCIYSWISPTGRIYSVLSYLCYPYLKPFRSIIPTWKNIDFSAIVFFILCNIILAFIAPLT